MVEVGVWPNGEQNFEKKPVTTFQSSRGLPGGSEVRNPPVDVGTTGTSVWSLGGEDFLEEGIATQSRILAWRIPWTEEPGGLQSTGLPRVRHDWSYLANTQSSRGLCRWLGGEESTCQWRRLRFDIWARKIPWRREWLPTPGFLPGEFHGQRSLEGYSPWGHKESDMTEWLNT